MRKRSLAALLVLVFLLTLSPMALAYSATRPPAGTVTHEHVWSDWFTTKAATCTEEGEHYSECGGCHQRYYESIPKIPHPFSDWTLVRQLTDTEPGLEQRVCSMCGLVEQRRIYADGTTQPVDPSEITGALIPITPVANPNNAGTANDPNNPNNDPNNPNNDPNNPNNDPNNPNNDPNNPNNDPNNPGLIPPVQANDPFVTISKSVTSVPADGIAYKPGETVTYYIQLDNNGAAGLQNLSVYDALQSGPLVSGAFVDSYGSLSTSFSLVVTDADALVGHIDNYATAEWINSETNSPGAGMSNPVSVPVAAEPTHEVDLYKGVTAGPANSLFYAYGETVHFWLYVTNTGNTVITEGTVKDTLPGGLGTVEVGSVDNLMPGDSRSFYVDYVVGFDDAMNGGFYNYASFSGTTEDGVNVSDEDYVYIQTGVDWPEAVLVKTEISHPANGNYYVAGEPIDYQVSVINVGNTTINYLEVYDDDGVNGGVLYDGGCTLDPCNVFTLYYSTTVDAYHVSQGEVLNYAYAFVYYTSGDQGFCSGIAQSPAGKPPESAAFTGPTGDGDFCTRHLESASGDSLNAAQDYCGKHAALAEQIAKLGEVPGMTEEKVAESALSLWLEAVNAEYTALGSRGNEAFAALAGMAREAFSSWLEKSGEELLQRCGDQTLVNQILAVKAQNHCAWLCYLNGAAVGERPDSYLAASLLPLSGQQHESCETTEQTEGAHVEQEEALCATHSAPEAALLQALQDGGDPLALFQQAKLSWLNAMSEQTRSEMTAGSGEDSVRLERAAFGKLLGAEERMLKVIYETHPEIVQELMLQFARSHVLDRCAAIG